MLAIESRRLSKTYRGNMAVKDLSLSVKKGEIYGFLGRNGAGKSTFINMLTGIIKPTSGTFKLLGEEDTRKVLPRIGVLPDYSSFYDNLTVKNHLEFFSKINGYHAASSEHEKVIHQVGLNGCANIKAGKLSFGMKKKLGIAQAIIHKPELIFLDEPTSGIDAESAIQIQQLIRELQQGGATIFMTSHNLHEVEKLATRIAIMKKGNVQHEGSLSELQKQYTSKFMVKIQHSALHGKEKEEILKLLKSFSLKVEYHDTCTILQIDSEDRIPPIVRILTSFHIDIYRVQAEKPSLEEIFLQENIGTALL